MMKQYLALRAEHNQWVNTRLYDVVAQVSDADYTADRGAFFGSIHQTLNHIVTTDMIWMHRIDGQSEVQADLDTVLHETFAETRAARDALDARMIAAVDGMDDAALAAPIRFKARAGNEVVLPTNLMIANLCNHETHHRGQVHAMLTGLGQEVPPLDFFPFLMATGRASG